MDGGGILCASQQQTCVEQRFIRRDCHEVLEFHGSKFSN